MSISQTRDIADGLYVPYHTASRDHENGLVGTLAVNAEATGDGGGGVVVILLRTRREEFGFPLLWVPTQVTLTDNLATAVDVILTMEPAGNRRLNASMNQRVAMAQVQSANMGNLVDITIPIEGVDETQQNILQAEWETNTNAKTYHVHMFGPVYDLQMIARLGHIDPLVAGIR